MMPGTLPLKPVPPEGHQLPLGHPRKPKSSHLGVSGNLAGVLSPPLRESLNPGLREWA